MSPTVRKGLSGSYCLKSTGFLQLSFTFQGHVYPFGHVPLIIVDNNVPLTSFITAAILRYLASKGHLRAMNKKPITPGKVNIEDTSWIAVLMAYVSVRGIVQWVVNFWIVKDNYFEGLERYRKFDIFYLVKLVLLKLS